MNKIIFFINCHVNKKYDSLLNLYLDDFKESGIENRDNVKLIFVVVGNPEDYLRVRKYIEVKLPGMFNDYEGKDRLTSYQSERIEFRVFDNSNYEHKGLEAVWKEAQSSDDDDLITYTHCRGISHQRQHHPEMNGSREVFSEIVSKYIILSNSDMEQIFVDNPSINRVGVGQSPGGWMWFNFWIAKASYLKKKERPLEYPVLSKDMSKYFDRFAKDRHYYEAWLGNGEDDTETGFSLLLNPQAAGVITGPQLLMGIGRLVSKLRKKTK